MIRSLTAAAACALLAGQASAQIASLAWRTIDGGGGAATGANYTLTSSIAQPDAGVLTGVGYELRGGFWPGPDGARCYANCDNSTVPPILNVSDFLCFQGHFAAGDAEANCDGSTIAPVLNVSDFICFQQKFAAGCP
jgi:hypothetical protein